MAKLAHLYGIIETLPLISKVYPKKIIQTKCHAKKFDDKYESHDQQISTRRSVIGVGSIALFAQFGVKTCLAEESNNNNNGFYFTSPPLGLPPIYNNIGNEETGTRSFLKKGVYMANIGADGSAYRLRKYAFDLLAMGDLISQDTLNYVRKYLRLKGTFMYYDFDKVISSAPLVDKPPLTNLANRLFDNFDMLLEAVKLKDLSLTQSCYKDTTVILQEVMDRMAA